MSDDTMRCLLQFVWSGDGAASVAFVKLAYCPASTCLKRAIVEMAYEFEDEILAYPVF
jgi:hypothetical protein